MEFTILHTTVSNSADAERLAQQLVAEQLAACVQIVGPLRSVYRWQGQVQSEPEYRIEAKIRRDAFARVAARLTELHPYDVPEILVVPVVDVAAGYADWLREQLPEA